jgi:hypothetical protein
VNRADLVGCGRSQLCQSTLKYWPFAPMRNVGEGSAGVKAGGSRRRLLAGAVALLVAGLLVGAGAAPLAARAPGPVELTVTKRLRGGAVAERVTLHIQTRTVGDLAVDRRHPVATLRLKLPYPGRYLYTLSSTAVFELRGERYPVVGHGGGSVEASVGGSVGVSADGRHRVPATMLISR